MKIKDRFKDNWVKSIQDSIANDKSGLHWSIISDVDEYYGNYEKGWLVTDEKGHMGIARCHPDDVYDEDFGKALAYARMRNFYIPNFDLVPISNLRDKVVMIDRTKYYVSRLPVTQLCLTGKQKKEYWLIPLYGVRGAMPKIMEESELISTDCIVDELVEGE